MRAQRLVVVGVVDEVGAVAAAALLQLRCLLGEHAQAALAEDAGPGAGEEGDVEDPGAVLVGVLEGDELVEVLVRLRLGGVVRRHGTVDATALGRSGRAVLGQGRERLAVVLGAERDDLVGLGEVERGRSGGLHPGVDRRLRVLDGERGAGGQPVGEGQGLGVQVVGRHGPVGEAEADRLLGRDGVAREEEALGQHRAEDEGPGDGATVAGDEADPHVGVADGGPFGHEHHVAEQRDGGAEAHGVPVHRSHDRQVHVEQVPDHGLGVEAEVLERGRVLEGREPAEVAAGREGLAPAGEQHGSGVALGLESREQRGEVLVQGAVDRVDGRRGVVDGHDQDVAVALEVDGGEVVAHVSPPRGRGSRGRPSSCSAMMFDSTSVVPPPMVRARENR